MTPLELRLSILKLAFQGKLVEQRTEEGSGEEQYQEILNEKKHLLKAGIIKKSKILPEVPEVDIPYSIPNKWQWGFLGNVVKEIIVPQRDKPTSFDGTIPWCRIEDIEGKYLNRTQSGKYVSRKTVDSMNLRVYPIGTVISANSASIGAAAITTVECCTNQTFIGLVCATGLYNEYLYYFLKANVSTLKKLGTGTTILYISQKKYERILIPIPPYSEQKRIVERIEELMPLVDQYEAAWNRLEDLNKRFPTELQKSILHYAVQGKLVEQRPEEGTGEELFKKIQKEKQALIKSKVIKKEKKLPEITENEIPYIIPNTWKWTRVGQVIKEVVVPQRDKPTFSPVGIPWCRIEDRDGYYLNGSKSNQLVSKATIDKMNLKVLPVGSVLSACTGGSIGTILINTVECCTNQTFNALICCSGLYNKYLFWFLKSKLDDLKSVGTGTTIAYVSQKKTKEMMIPLPPAAEQNRIVAKIEELLLLCEALR